VRRGRYGEYEHGSNEGKRSEDFRHIGLPSDSAGITSPGF
jgi:hypothetical protein